MEKQKVIQSPKVAVNETAENVLASAFNKVNDGFLGGKISKLDLASWGLLDSLENLTDGKIEKIRKCFFNEICYLESVVKMSRQNGLDKLTPEQIATFQNLFSHKNEKARKPKEEQKNPEEIE